MVLPRKKNRESSATYISAEYPVLDESATTILTKPNRSRWWAHQCARWALWNPRRANAADESIFYGSVTWWLRFCRLCKFPRGFRSDTPGYHVYFACLFGISLVALGSPKRSRCGDALPLGSGGNLAPLCDDALSCCPTRHTTAHRFHDRCLCCGVHS